MQKCKNLRRKRKQVDQMRVKLSGETITSDNIEIIKELALALEVISWLQQNIASLQQSQGPGSAHKPKPFTL